MANVTSMKGVRTRYRNILARQLDNANSIVSCSKSEIDAKLVCYADAHKCLSLLKTYSGKLDEQMKRLADAISESDPEFASKVLDEDCELIFEVENCTIELEQCINSLNSAEERKGVLPETEKIFQVQEKLQNMVISQMQDQRDFFERDANRHIIESKSVKLPKLELCSYDGNKLKWIEFWDSFECTVHRNSKISNVEKLTYLLSKLSGAAKSAVSGLALSNENYGIAIKILKERFGNKQEMVDLHYKELMSMLPATPKVESLRLFLDVLEKNLRSLEVLHEDVNQSLFVSIIRSKLPEEVLRQLEFSKGTKTEWTVDNLRHQLNEYVFACEKAENRGQPNEQMDSQQKSQPWNVRKRSQQTNQVPDLSGTASSLLANTNSSLQSKYFNICRYCTDRHWSDECPVYTTISERKKKIQGSCYRCLNDGHKANQCKLNRICVHCGEQNSHHRSLCSKRFKQNPTNEHMHLSEEMYGDANSCTAFEENAMISANEMVLMQTTTSVVSNTNQGNSQKVRILLDSGSQRTYITQRLADQLGLKGKKEEEIKLVTFGRDKPTVIKTKRTTMCLKLNDGTFMSLETNIVPVISGNIQRRKVNIAPHSNLNHLIKSLDLADSIPRESECTRIEMLIGNDYYLDVILPQRIEVQPGLYLLGSKLGWILTGRTRDCDIDNDVSSMLILTHGNHITSDSVFQCVDKSASSKPELQDFWNIEAIGGEGRSYYS